MFLLIYQNPKNATSKTKLHRAIYGFTDYSNNNKYKYERKGLFHNGGIRKLSKSTLIIEDAILENIKNTILSLGGTFVIQKIHDE